MNFEQFCEYMNSFGNEYTKEELKEMWEAEMRAEHDI